MDDNVLQVEYFDQVAYRDPMHPVVSAYADPKVQFINQYVPLRGRVLDVGCGNGIFTLRFANAGASEVFAVATHPILSDPACERLNKSNIVEIVTTNSILLRPKVQMELKKLKVLSVATLIAEAVKRIHNEESVSSLFN